MSTHDVFSAASQKLLEYLAQELRKNRARGDIQTMLAALWNKRNNPTLHQKPTKRPRGYRGMAMPNYVKERCGARLLRWGPTAIRGDLGAEKAHISRFIELVNALPSEEAELRRVFDQAAEMVCQWLHSQPSIVQLPEASLAQRALEKLLKVRSGGRVQQGVVYSLLKVLYEDSEDIQVISKAVYAGDAQSGLPGDVNVIEAGDILASYEVKAMSLDEASYSQALKTHTELSGEGWNYPLFFLAEDFEESLEERHNIFFIDLRDFCLTILGEIVAQKRMSSEEALRKVLEVYNEDFCEHVQKDPTLRVNFEE